MIESTRRILIDDRNTQRHENEGLFASIKYQSLVPGTQIGMKEWNRYPRHNLSKLINSSLSVSYSWMLSTIEVGQGYVKIKSTEKLSSWFVLEPNATN